MFRFTKNIFCLYISLFIFILPINLKSEPIDDHCHCVNAQQQSFEYLDDIEQSEISKSTEAVPASTKEILIQEKPEDIWNIVNKGYRIPDPKKKWAKKVVKKYERWYSEHPVYTYRMFTEPTLIFFNYFFSPFLIWVRNSITFINDIPNIFWLFLN